MEITLLLQTLPGMGRVGIRKFIKENSFLLDNDYLDYYIKVTTGSSPIFYRDRVKNIKENCFKMGVEILSADNLDIIDSPLLLFVKGDKSLLNREKIISVVGTREPSNKSILKGRELVKEAVAKGFVTVSGLAKGCDTICHRSTVENSGETVAVIPYGYREETAPWILEDGLIISEYPPLSPIRKYKCVERNRIITGLSNGLYLIESNRGGGSEHSLRYAHKQGKTIVFTSGFEGIKEYDAEYIPGKREFDLFLKKCIK